ncbi:peroxin 14 17 protein [Rutstroemia sp. NJR-2017a BVV2]|nr:peroxin 14 17 protein [Rutstroemia sp. NJR-2017a BVV2]
MKTIILKLQQQASLLHAMGNSEDRKPNTGIPEWQRKRKDDEVATPPPTTKESPSQLSAIEQAKQFLEEDELKDATTDKKIAFLESKGLQKEDIQELLGVTRNEEATGSAVTSSTVPKGAPIEPAPETQSLVLRRSSPPQNQPTQVYTPPREQAPIITYPEFLVQPTGPQPLITKHRLLTTLYLFGSLSFLLHGTNTFLIRPMFQTLTESRLSLSSTTLSNLQKLIKKLESSVSEIPITYSVHHKGSLHPEYLDSDAESQTSDPTELFHRDIGIQTSLPSSPTMHTPGSPSWGSSNANSNAGSTTTIQQQTARLARMKSVLSSFVDDSKDEESSAQDLNTRMDLLKEYLQGLAYTAPTFGYGGGAFSNGGRGDNGRDKEDEISKVKREIRGVKGVLLSARSFPGAVRTR